MKERIRVLRKNMKLTQAEFANKIGITRTGYSSLENGDAPVQERHIKLILAAYPDVSENWLRTGEGEPFRRSDSAVPDIIKRYGFGDLVQKLLEAYEELDPDAQEAVLEYTQNVVAKIVAGHEKPIVSPPVIKEDDIEKEVEQYRKQLIAQKKAASSPSPGTDAIDEVG